MALEKKINLLLDLNPDIAIVQECSRKDIESLRRYGYETFWFGSIPYKGIGIVYRAPWTARLMAEPTHRWLIPLEFEGPDTFRLIAVWSCPPKTGFSQYVACVSDAIRANPNWFEGGSVVLAGDFNSSSEWDKHTKGAHSALVEMLGTSGLVSIYHHHHNQQHGNEENHTHHFRRHLNEQFHIDYVFAPQSWTTRVKSLVIGDPEVWNNYSDHCPITLDLEPPTN